MRSFTSSLLFFFNPPAPTESYTLSLHDALPISRAGELLLQRAPPGRHRERLHRGRGTPGLGRSVARSRVVEPRLDRKSTRLNSSHMSISYAVFCLKKKKKQNTVTHALMQEEIKW